MASPFQVKDWKKSKEGREMHLSFQRNLASHQSAGSLVKVRCLNFQLKLKLAEVATFLFLLNRLLYYAMRQTECNSVNAISAVKITCERKMFYRY